MKELTCPLIHHQLPQPSLDASDQSGKQDPVEKTEEREVGPRAQKLHGQRFGRWTVLRLSNRKHGTNLIWICRCDCGNEKEVKGSWLRNGDSSSCGCLRKELTSKRSTTHGATTGRKRTSEYAIWRTMKARCSNPNVRSYKYYGLRGIKVCNRWLKFDNFIADMGHRPSSRHTIDRRDTNGHYEPGNCAWATYLEQNNNRRNNRPVMICGISKNIGQWMREIGVGRDQMMALIRLKPKWITEPIVQAG